MELMDWSPRHVRLWGGYYTSLVLDRFLDMANGSEREFGGMFEQLSHHGWETEYERFKRIEKSKTRKTAKN